MLGIPRTHTLALASVFACVLWGCTAQPIFEPEELDAIAQNIANDIEEQAEEPITPDTLLETVRTAFQAGSYGDKIRANIAWQIDDGNVGMNHFALLYASSSEYLTIIGSQLGKEWVYGPYDTEIYDFVLDGMLLVYPPGTFDPVEYGPGETALLSKETTGAYHIPDYAWILEYGRDNAASGPYAQIIFDTGEQSALGLIAAEAIGGLGSSVANEYIRTLISDWLGISTGFPF